MRHNLRMIHKPVAFALPIHIPHGVADWDGNIKRFPYGGQEFHIYCIDVSFADPPEPTTYEGSSDEGIICTVQKTDGKWYLLELRP